MRRALTGSLTAVLLLAGDAFSFLAVQAEAGAQKRPAVLMVRCDRPDATYKVGETALFRVEGLEDGAATYRLSEDGVKTIAEGKLLPEKGKEVKGALKSPGFLRLRVSQGKRQALAAAAFDPTKIAPTARLPADFDAFWESGKKELAKVHVDAKLEHVPKQSDGRVDCYKISLGNVQGKRVRGWLSVPRGKGPFPAVLTVPGAGVYGIGPDKYHAYLGALSLNIIIHDLPVDEAPAFYKKQAAGPLEDYRDIGMDDRDKSYYRIASPLMGRGTDPRWVKAREELWKRNLALRPPK